MITQLRNKETGFSLLELSVAVGVAAIVAAGAITATTGFIGSAQDKRDNYTANADNAIEAAESSSIALGTAESVEAPGIVGDFYAMATTETTAGMVWTSPRTGDSVEEYQIIIEGEVVATLPGNTATYTVTGLQPGTYVSITIKAINAGGSSEESSGVTTQQQTNFSI